MYNKKVTVKGMHVYPDGVGGWGAGGWGAGWWGAHKKLHTNKYW